MKSLHIITICRRRLRLWLSLCRGRLRPWFFIPQASSPVALFMPRTSLSVAFLYIRGFRHSGESKNQSISNKRAEGSEILHQTPKVQSGSYFTKTEGFAKPLPLFLEKSGKKSALIVLFGCVACLLLPQKLSRFASCFCGYTRSPSSLLSKLNTLHHN